MRTRRNFLVSTVAMAASLAMRPSLAFNATSSAGSCFDLSAARRLVIEQRSYIAGATCLDLSEYCSSSQEAIEYLVGNVGAIDCIDIGFHELSPEGARSLLQLKTSFLFLTGLVRLETDVANELWWTPETLPIRQVRVKEPLSESAALALAQAPMNHRMQGSWCGRPLDISVPSISPSVAQALSFQDHELYLQVRGEDQMSIWAAEALAHHVGYRLDLSLWRQEPTPAIIRALSSNPGKRLEMKQGAVGMNGERNWHMAVCQGK